MNQVNTPVISPLKNWIPTRIIHKDDNVICQWIYTGSERYCDPFFDETIVKYKVLPENSSSYKCLSEAGMLSEFTTDIDSIYPTAIIFHVSRCGSTLISQALGASLANISVSEVPVFDEILRLQLKGWRIDGAALDDMFTSVVKFYGARKSDYEQRFFIKTDCWHLLFYDRIRRLYPDVPFIVIYRNPAEVLESNRRHRGIQGTYGVVEPALFGFDNDIPEALIHPDNYIVAVLEKLYSSIIDIAARDKDVLMLDYKEGFSIMMQKLIQFTGLTLSATELAAIEDRGRFNAKSPAAKFVEQNTGDRIHEQSRLQELYNLIVHNATQRF